jgi:MYXO-CTERM domain-containing protein
MRRRGPQRLVRAALAASVLLLAKASLADAVMPPPEGCPPGSIGHSSHLGPFCAPTTCNTDDDCKNQGSWRDRDKGRTLVCEDRQALCIEQKDFTRWRGRADAGKNLRPVAVAACDRGGVCASPAVCETARRCVFEDDPGQAAPQTGAGPSQGPPSKPTGASGASSKSPPKSGCACALGESSEDAGALSLLLLGLGLLASRRSRRALSYDGAASGPKPRRAGARNACVHNN